MVAVAEALPLAEVDAAGVGDEGAVAEPDEDRELEAAPVRDDD